LCWPYGNAFHINNVIGIQYENIAAVKRSHGIHCYSKGKAWFGGKTIAKNMAKWLSESTSKKSAGGDFCFILSQALIGAVLRHLENGRNNTNKGPVQVHAKLEAMLQSRHG
jgi:hypothetical protein